MSLTRHLLVFAFALSACAPSAPNKSAPILLFSGAGTSRNDVAAVQAVLESRKLDYTTANSQQLNGMSELEISKFKLLIIPGGNFITMSESLSPGTMANVQRAVQNGVNYLGICAGAFLAAHGTYNSLNLTSGVRFGFYSAERQNIRKAVLAIAAVNGEPIEQYWEDGPELSGWGAVVAKYPDSTPAIVEGSFGKGWVILAGTHPEAPEHWRRGLTFTMPAKVANEYAGTLVESALNGMSLPHY